MNGGSDDESNWCVERLIAPLPSISPDALGQTVYEMMIADPTAPSFAVVQNRQPIGLLSHQRPRQAEPGRHRHRPASKSLVERHGGTLELASELGRGTKVTVRLTPHRLRFHAGASDMASATAPDHDVSPPRLSATG